MRIDFNEIASMTFPGMNNGTGMMSARMYNDVFLFAVLGLLAGEAWGWIGVGAAGVWSIVDEATKVWIPGRHCSAVDIGLNLIGVVVACGCYLLLSR